MVAIHLEKIKLKFTYLRIRGRTRNGAKGHCEQQHNHGNERCTRCMTLPHIPHSDPVSHESWADLLGNSCSLCEWIAQFSLTRETCRIPRVCIPLVLTVIHVTIAVLIDHTVSTVKWIELEVEFPTCGHPIFIMVLVIDFRTIIPVVTICIICDWVGAVLEFFEVCVILKVVIESLAVW